MKKFFNRNWAKILVSVLVVAFALLVMFTEDKGTENNNNIENNPTLSTWLEETAGDKPVVTVLALTTCGYCANYKPVMDEIKGENDFVLYWYYIDEVSDEDYATLTSTYELANFEGSVPYTFVTKNGEFVADTIGAMEKADTLQFLKDNNVLE